MAWPVSVFLGLDVLSALLTFALVGFFADAWRKTGSERHLLFALGFLLVGASFVSATPSHFDLGEKPGAWDGLRLAGQLGGALVLALAYVGAGWPGRARIPLVVGFAVAATSLVFALVTWIVPPFGRLTMVAVFPVAHALMVVAYLTCAAHAFRGVLRTPRADRLLVPVAFLAWAMTKYTWLLIDLSGAGDLAPFVYLWRFTAVACLLAAVVAPGRAGGAHAAA